MSFKEFNPSSDISVQYSSINEIMPITGTLFSGSTYTKKYINITSGSAVSGGFWETVYDGSPTSISSSALCDLTYGHSSASFIAGRAETFMNNEKKRIYRQMAAHLLGDANSRFNFNNVNHDDLFFICLKRRLFKDEIRKGQTSVLYRADGADLSLADVGAASSYVIGFAGDEGKLYSGSIEVGKVYYNAGIIVVSTGALSPATGSPVEWSGNLAINQIAISGNIDNMVDGFKNRMANVQFQNQTNLNSTIYFCRAMNAEYNYSSNPTFIDSQGRIVPTSGSDNQTRTYITTIGLYDVNDNLLGVAKTSEPIKKSPDSELVFRVRLSF